METNLGDGRIRIAWKGVAGRAGVVPNLVLNGTLLATGYRPGATAQIEVQATITWQVQGGHSFLGVFNPKTLLLRWPTPLYSQPDAAPADEMTTPIELSLPLPTLSIETLERARHGDGFSLLLNPTVILLDSGHSATPRTSAYYESLSARTDQDTLAISANEWIAVLDAWGTGTGMTVLVPLSAADPAPERAEIVDHLRVARGKINGADYTGAIAEARQALELLRGFRSPERPLPKMPAAPDRNPLERIYAIVDALFSFASAPAHTDPPVKDFTPERADATAVVAGAASVAQQLFHWLDK